MHIDHLTLILSRCCARCRGRRKTDQLRTKGEGGARAADLGEKFPARLEAAEKERLLERLEFIGHGIGSCLTTRSDCPGFISRKRSEANERVSLVLTFAGEIETVLLPEPKSRTTGSLGPSHAMAMGVMRNVLSALLGAGKLLVDFAGVGRVLIAPPDLFGNARLFGSFMKARVCGPLKSWRLSLGLERAVSCLVAAVGFVAVLSSASLGQQFRDVSRE